MELGFVPGNKQTNKGFRIIEDDAEWKEDNQWLNVLFVFCFGNLLFWVKFIQSKTS